MLTLPLLLTRAAVVLIGLRFLWIFYNLCSQLIALALLSNSPFPVYCLSRGFNAIGQPAIRTVASWLLRRMIFVPEMGDNLNPIGVMFSPSQYASFHLSTPNNGDSRT